MDEGKTVDCYIHFGKRQELVRQISHDHFVSFASRGLALTHHLFFVVG